MFARDSRTGNCEALIRAFELILLSKDLLFWSLPPLESSAFF